MNHKALKDAEADAANIVMYRFYFFSVLFLCSISRLKQFDIDFWRDYHHNLVTFNLNVDGEK